MASSGRNVHSAVGTIRLAIGYGGERVLDRAVHRARCDISSTATSARSSRVSTAAHVWKITIIARGMRALMGKIQVAGPMR
jgi:hypothetical protein